MKFSSILAYFLFIHFNSISSFLEFNFGQFLKKFYANLDEIFVNFEFISGLFLIHFQFNFIIFRIHFWSIQHQFLYSFRLDFAQPELRGTRTPVRRNWTEPWCGWGSFRTRRRTPARRCSSCWRRHCAVRDWAATSWWESLSTSPTTPSSSAGRPAGSPRLSSPSAPNSVNSDLRYKIVLNF